MAEPKLSLLPLPKPARHKMKRETKNRKAVTLVTFEEGSTD